MLRNHTYSNSSFHYRWFQWMLDFGFFEAKIAEYKISYGVSHIHLKSCWLTQERLEEDTFSTFFLIYLRSRSTAVHKLQKTYWNIAIIVNPKKKVLARPLRLKNTALLLSYKILHIFWGKKLLNNIWTNIFFKNRLKNSGPSN